MCITTLWINQAQNGRVSSKYELSLKAPGDQSQTEMNQEQSGAQKLTTQISDMHSLNHSGILRAFWRRAFIQKCPEQVTND